IAYFRRDLLRLAKAAFTAPRTKDGRLAWLIALSAVPAAVVGGLWADTIEENTDRIWMIAVMLIVGALLLGFADGTRGKRTIDEVSLTDAVAMGIGQAIALQPGVSRSGVTITVGRFVGLSRDGAARFAFLMSLPITAGALVFKWFDVQGEGGIPADMRAAFLWGIVSSAITGYIAVWGTLRLIRTQSFAPFVLYRLVLGVVILLLLAVGFRSGAAPPDPVSASATTPPVAAHATRGASPRGTATVTASSPTSTTVAPSTTGNAGAPPATSRSGAGSTARTSTRSPTASGGVGRGPVGTATARWPGSRRAAAPVAPCGARRAACSGSPATTGWRTTAPTGTCASGSPGSRAAGRWRSAAASGSTRSPGARSRVATATARVRPQRSRAASAASARARTVRAVAAARTPTAARRTAGRARARRARTGRARGRWDTACLRASGDWRGSREPGRDASAPGG